MARINKSHLRLNTKVGYVVRKWLKFRLWSGIQGA